jgi:hypothetical protein
MSSVGEPSNRYDLFLSHGSPDKEWVRALRQAIETEGLRVFLDEKDLKPGENWVISLVGWASPTIGRKERWAMPTLQDWGPSSDPGRCPEGAGVRRRTPATRPRMRGFRASSGYTRCHQACRLCSRPASCLHSVPTEIALSTRVRRGRSG